MGLLTTEAFLRDRPLLFSVAYRLLGSASDAEDVLQEAWLRLQGTGEVRDERAYAVRVVTHLCLDELRSARARRERYVGPWLPEPVLTGEHAGTDPLAEVERRELLSLGALTLLEALSPRQRAVLVLREAVGLDHAAIAAVLGIREDASRQLLVRARDALAARGAPAPARPPRPEQHARLVAALREVFDTGEVGPLLAVLHEDAELLTDGGGDVQAARRPILGREKIGRFVAAVLPRAPQGLAAVPAEVNGEPALVLHADGVPAYVLSPVVRGGQVERLLVVMAPGKLRYAAAQGLHVPA